MKIGQSLLAILVTTALAVPVLGATEGSIAGRIVDSGGNGIEGVTVSLRQVGATSISDNDGRFAFDRLSPGQYTIDFTLGRQAATETVTVEAGQVRSVDKQVAWTPEVTEMVTVYGASRQVERIVDAPAAVTVVTEEEIEKQASHGQLPKLLEFTPGAEVTQSGLYDYNLNTRGFNSSLNRRVATLIDGRDPSVPFLGAQSWAAIAFPLDDLATVEFVRGPGAALYGANAASGVLMLVSKQPRYSLGGTLRLAGGEIGTFNADVRWAKSLGSDWYLKLQGGVRNSGDFTVSRVGAAEYSVPCPVPQGTATDCLPQEPVPLARIDDNDIVFGGLRVDKYMDGGVFTLEGGSTTIKGPVYQTGIGRVQLLDVDRPWARINYTADHWNIFASYTSRDAPRQLSLATGSNLALDTERLQLEAQGHWNFGEKNHRIVIGGAFASEELDSFDPEQGRQTVMFSPIENDKNSLYAQLDVNLSERLRLALASRWDDADIHDSQFSPKVSLVYSATPDHSVRFSYNEAFQVGAYSELFINARAAPNADLSTFELLCLVNGVADCDLAGPTLGGSGTRILALGNDDLEVEETELFEIGYTGVFRGQVVLTLDYYFADNENFITDLLPNVGTSLGRINPDFGPWQGSAAAETTPITSVDLNGDGTPDLPPALLGLPVAVGVRSLCESSPSCGGLLSNNIDGENIIAARSYTNFGSVDTQGIDAGIEYFTPTGWTFRFNYSWFDFDIKEGAPGLDDLLLPNSPEGKASIGAAYAGSKLSGGLNLRWVDDFRWVAGPFQGDVDSYTTADLNVNYRINDSWQIGANIANLLDDDHYEAFGGDLAARRALAHVQYDWR